MKKTLAMLLGIMLLSVCVLAGAEQPAETLGTLSVNGSFRIQCRLPEGYNLSVLDADSASIIASVTSEDASKPRITLSIAFNDSFTAEDGTAMRLNDLPAETVEAMKNSFLEQMYSAEVKEAETAYGTKLLIVNGEITEGSRIVDIWSVYKSYEIEVVAYAGEGLEAEGLTGEQIAMIINFLSDMDFVEA